MSQILDRLEFLRTMDAVYWRYTGPDGKGGDNFDSPEDIKVRWQEKQETFMDATGNEAVSHAIVYPEKTLVRDSYLWLGTIASLPSAFNGDPRSLPDARQVRQIGNSPTFENDGEVDKVWL